MTNLDFMKPKPPGKHSVKIHPGKIGYVSLVGIITHRFPLSFGNYFSCDGYHMLNMWYENWNHLLETGVIKETDKIKGTAFGNGVIITDPKIPKDYLNKKLCFTGSHGGIGPMDDLYKFFYQEFSKLKCMCCEEAEYSSYVCNQRTVGNYPMQLDSGYCRICNRKLYFNYGKEISEDEYGILYVEFTKLAFSNERE